MFKSSSIASAMLAAITGLFSGIMPAVPSATGWSPSPTSSRRTRNVMHRTKNWDGRHIRTDNPTLAHGEPGAKLARKAAEGRLGLYAGRK